MAELAVIMSMITVTSTAASVLGIIKRRCGASQTIAELATNCAELVEKIRTLLKTLEGDAQVPRDARRISTALNLRREEFDEILKKLDKLKRNTKRTHPVDRTEKFIKAQGWAKRMEAIYNNLVQLRNGIENIVSNWDAAQFLVTKLEEIVTIDVTKSEVLEKREQHAECEIMGSGASNYVDRIQMALVKLTKENKEALSRYGNLKELSLPDALFKAADSVGLKDKTSFIQLMERSAELLNPWANRWMGLAYKNGVLVEKDLKSALFHFRVASSLGDVYSMIELISNFDNENGWQNLLNYVNTASNMAPELIDQILSNYYPNGYIFENGEQEQHLIRASQCMCALDQSYDHFFGISARRSNRKAIASLPTFDSGSYSVHFDAEDSNCFNIRFCIRPHHYDWIYWNDSMREYLNFLFESNQFLPFFIWSYDLDIYSPRQWKNFILHAANSNCVDAHVLLAEFYSTLGHRNEREMKRHLRIAADAGHSQAQSIYRQLFGKRSNMSRRLKLVQDNREGDEGKVRHRMRMKQSEKKGGNTHRKQNA